MSYGPLSKGLMKLLPHKQLQLNAARAKNSYWEKSMVAHKTIQVTLVKSTSGRVKSHQACVKGLSLRKIGQTVSVIDTPDNRGMINKVSYLLQTKEVS